MLLFWALACAEAPAPICEAYATTAVAADGVLSNEDSCGYWQLAVDDQLVVSVELTGPLDDPDQDCALTLGDGLDRPYEPTYANFEDDVPKMTWQVFGTAAATASRIDITCVEGTSWSAQVDVVE